MEPNFSNDRRGSASAAISAALAGCAFALFCAAGCDSPASPLPPAATKAKPAAKAGKPAGFEKPIRQDEAEALDRMRSLLDGGDKSGAMRTARGLMGSDDYRVKGLIIDAFAWCGRVAAPELTELMDDPDERVSHSALAGFSHMLQSVESAKVRLALAGKAALAVRSSAMREGVLHAFYCEEEAPAVEALDAMLEICGNGVCRVQLEKARREIGRDGL